MTVDREQLGVEGKVVVFNLVDQHGGNRLVDFQAVVFLFIPETEIVVAVEEEHESDQKENRHDCPCDYN